MPKTADPTPEDHERARAVPYSNLRMRYDVMLDDVLVASHLRKDEAEARAKGINKAINTALAEQRETDRKEISVLRELVDEAHGFVADGEQRGDASAKAWIERAVAIRRGDA